VVEPTPQNFTKAINYFFQNRSQLQKKSKITRQYATKNFSSKNAIVIIRSFNPQ
jgi:hypothetical protein